MMMAGHVGIIGHLTIEDNTIIAAQSGISKDLPGGAWFGSPAVAVARGEAADCLDYRLASCSIGSKRSKKKLGSERVAGSGKPRGFKMARIVLY